MIDNRFRRDDRNAPDDESTDHHLRAGTETVTSGVRRPWTTTVLAITVVTVLAGSLLLLGAAGSVSAVDGSVDATSTDDSLEEYAGDDGVVGTDGLREAIDDWDDGDADAALVREAVDAWRSGEPVAESDAISVDVADGNEGGAETYSIDVTFDEVGSTSADGPAEYVYLNTTGVDLSDVSSESVTLEGTDRTVEGLALEVDDGETDHGYGVNVTADATGATIVDNHFDLEEVDDDWVSGVDVEGDAATVEENVFDGTFDTTGVRVAGADDAWIAGNTFDGHTDGLVIRQQSSFHASDNEFSVGRNAIWHRSGTGDVLDNSVDEANMGLTLG